MQVFFFRCSLVRACLCVREREHGMVHILPLCPCVHACVRVRAREESLGRVMLTVG